MRLRLVYIRLFWMSVKKKWLLVDLDWKPEEKNVRSGKSPKSWGFRVRMYPELRSVR